MNRDRPARATTTARQDAGSASALATTTGPLVQAEGVDDAPGAWIEPRDGLRWEKGNYTVSSSSGRSTMTHSASQRPSDRASAAVGRPDDHE
jgi:hypothetical protein